MGQPRSVLRGLREARALSQQELATLAGLEVTKISRIERGQEPGLDDARALAKALGVTVDFLFPEDQEAAVG